MNCPNCKNEIDENQKFCTKCGASINASAVTVQKNTSFLKNNKLIVLLLSILILFSGIVCYSVVQSNTTENSSYNLETPTQVLTKIDELQAQYFTIIKRNNVLLHVNDDEDCMRDMKELNNLFAEVEKKIDKNNHYLQQYHKINERFSVCSGETTVEMANFSSEHYKAIDKLLNDVYQEVRKTISKEEFKALITSEIDWLKEVDSYYSVYEEQGFGSMGVLVKLEYEINMRSFRTLLLMLYL